VIAQSFSPEHPALVMAARQDYPTFHASESRLRQALGYPPFSHLTALLVSAEDASRGWQVAQALGDRVRADVPAPAQVLGPAPAPIARIQDRWRFQLIVKSPQRKEMGQALRRAVEAVRPPDDVSVEIDVDAQSLL
jgi:primosomal protein N' (replication factor Y)